jgi:hypothetical protein
VPKDLTLCDRFTVTSQAVLKFTTQDFALWGVTVLLTLPNVWTGESRYHRGKVCSFVGMWIAVGFIEELPSKARR